MPFDANVPAISSIKTAYESIVAGEFISIAQREGFAQTFGQLAAPGAAANIQVQIPSTTIGGSTNDDGVSPSILARDLIGYGRNLAGYFFSQVRARCMELATAIQTTELGTDLPPDIGIFALLTSFDFTTRSNSANPSQVVISGTGVSNNIPQGAICRIGFLNGRYSYIGTKLPYDRVVDGNIVAGIVEADLTNAANWRFRGE